MRLINKVNFNRKTSLMFLWFLILMLIKKDKKDVNENKNKIQGGILQSRQKKGVSTQGGKGSFDPGRVMVLSIGPGSGMNSLRSREGIVF